MPRWSTDLPRDVAGACHAGSVPTLLALMLAVTPGGTVHAAEPTVARTLRVATRPEIPFVFPQSEPLTGFSVDLWTELARRMGVETSWTVLPAQADLLQAVVQGDADVAISAIPMTVAGERRVDLSHPYFDSGLQIAVRARNARPFLDTLRAIPWLSIGELVAATVVVVFLFANLLLLLERAREPSSPATYWRAIGEALWGTMLIIATGEHGDRNAPGLVRRLAVASMWLVGVVIIAHLTATVTTSQTVDRLQSAIQGPENLPGKTIGTLAGSDAADYLTQRGLPFVDVKDGPQAVRMLLRGEVDAVVFDAPTIQYVAAREASAGVRVVGPVFQPTKYVIAVATGSSLRKEINEALLGLREDGTHEKLRAKWFARRD